MSEIVRKNKLGLVLSGGGAKGAYQVGVLEYMAEINMEIDALSGTSIGALNGAVISSQRDLAKSAKILRTIWEELGSQPPLKLKAPNVITVLDVFSSLLPASQFKVVSKIFLKAVKYKDIPKDLRAWFDDEYRESNDYQNKLNEENKGAFSSSPSIDVLNKYAPKNLLLNGLEYFVGLYESDGNFQDFAEYIKGDIFRLESTKQSKFWKIQDLDKSEIHEAILASAALPVLFNGRAIKGKIYRDGGIGGAHNQSGNTPVQPLIDSGCTHIIVTHLNDGSFWNRHNFPDVAFIEVRPKEFISNSVSDLMVFKPEKINDWIKQGYTDAKRCIGDVHKARKAIDRNQTVQNMINDKLDRLDSDDFDING